MEIYVLDKELNMLGILDNYFSLRWIRRYSKHGEFEIHCTLNNNNLSLLNKHNVIFKSDDLEGGYIEYRNISQDEEGKEVLVVRGKFLTGYMNRRIIWNLENLNSTSEVAIRSLLNNHLITCIDVGRQMPLMTLESLRGLSPTIDIQISYKNLLDQVEDIALTSEIGIRALLDIQNKLIKFDIYEGLDRTQGQAINPRVIFSREFENVLSQEYTDSLNNYKNVALVGGQGEGALREFATVGDKTGLDRFEMFVDAKDLQKETMTDLEYKAKLETRGNTKLAENAEVISFDSRINLNSNLTYKVDFDLGDKVTCISKKWGVTIDRRITEVEEIYEEDGFNVNVVFGDSLPTILDKIKAVSK